MSPGSPNHSYHATPISSKPVTVSPASATAAIDAFGALPRATSGENSNSRPMEDDAVRKVLGLPAQPRDVDPASSSTASGCYAGGGYTKEARRMGGRKGASDERGLGSGPGAIAAATAASRSHSPEDAPLCLLLNNLGELFRWDPASAASMCADAFPGVRPW